MADLFNFFALKARPTETADEIEVQLNGLTPGFKTFVESCPEIGGWSELTNFVPDKASFSLRQRVGPSFSARYFRAYTK